MAAGEGRLSRWSRLKRKGGAAEGEEREVARERELREAAEARPAPIAVDLPGGVRVRNFVPAMAPLAPGPEDGDDRLTRGVGHAPDADETRAAPDADETRAAPDADETRAAPDADIAAPAEADALADIEERELTDAEREIVAGLPPVESLTADSDFTPFLKDGVPDFVKRKALRMLWRKDPFFNIRDGLNDYDEDFNVVHKIIDEMTGAYRVGRGHLSEDELRGMTPEEARRAFDSEEEAAPSDNDAEATEADGDGNLAESSDMSAARGDGDGSAASRLNGRKVADTKALRIETRDPDDDDIGDGDADTEL